MLRKSVVFVFIRPGIKARQHEELQLKRVKLESREKEWFPGFSITINN